MKPQLTPLSIDGAFRSTAPHDPIRAISVQLACWRRHARSAIVPPLRVRLLSLDVCIHRLGDGLVSTPGRVLVKAAPLRGAAPGVSAGLCPGRPARRTPGGTQLGRH